MCESHSFFRRIGQLPPNRFQISMAPLKQWTLKFPVNPSATSSLYSPLYLTYTTRSIIPLCFNQNSKLTATPLLFLLWVDTVLGVTEDVPPWGRSVHQGCMVTILRPTPPLSIHPTLPLCFLSTLPSTPFFSCLPQTSDRPHPSLSSLGVQPCLLLHREHCVHYTEQSYPPTTKHSSQPTSCLFPGLFSLPPIRSACPHASKSIFCLPQETYMKTYPLFSLLPPNWNSPNRA